MTKRDVLEGRVDFQKALVKDKRGFSLWLLPANQTKNKDAADPKKWLRLVEEIKSSGQYEYIFIDTPAGIEKGFHIASSPADSALVAVNPEVSSVRDADRIIGILENMGKVDYKLIINRIRWDAVEKGQMLSVEDVVEILKAPLLGVVPEEPKMVDFTNRGEPIVLGDYPASKALMDIAKWKDDSSLKNIIDKSQMNEEINKKVSFWDGQSFRPLTYHRIKKKIVLSSTQQMLKN